MLINEKLIEELVTANLFSKKIEENFFSDFFSENIHSKKDIEQLLKQDEFGCSFFYHITDIDIINNLLPILENHLKKYYSDEESIDIIKQKLIVEKNQQGKSILEIAKLEKNVALINKISGLVFKEELTSLNKSFQKKVLFKEKQDV